MTTHKSGTREQWLKARLELLKAEKELTRRSDQLARKRQECRGCSCRDSNSRAWMRLSFQFKSDPNSPGYMHVPNCAWTVT